MKPSYLYSDSEKNHIGSAYQINIVALKKHFYTELKITIVYNIIKTVKYMA